MGGKTGAAARRWRTGCEGGVRGANYGAIGLSEWRMDALLTSPTCMRRASTLLEHAIVIPKDRARACQERTTIIDGFVCARGRSYSMAPSRKHVDNDSDT